MVKIKVRPEDFVVQELLELPLEKKGRYTILELEKRFWNTLDVIDFVARKIRVPKSMFGRAGLKDRYSHSTQYLSFKGDFRETLKEDNFTLRPIGKSNTAVKPSMLRGNSFCITLRNISAAEAQKIDHNTDEVTNHGFPNYFDEQRFGSARHGQGFIAKKLILEHYQGALKLLLCYPYKEDSANEKKFKQYCMSHWRDWSGCSKIAPPFYRSILHYLILHPKDFKNGLKKIDREFLNLYLLAYQSFLFNEVLAAVIKQHGQDNVRIRYSMGEYVIYRTLHQAQTLKELRLPMLNNKTELADAMGDIINMLLKKENITLKAMALEKMRLRGVRFKSFERHAIVFPEEFTVTKLEPDEIYPDQYKCQVKCILPPGTYATILIKRLLV
jgi:tRNA pseudouridine13 synthase